MRKKLTIVTRQSVLALWQAEYVKKSLQNLYPSLEVEILKITTKGDRFLEAPLQKIGGKGLFVKELEQKLLSGEADIAVHSLKDVPFELPEGLELSVILNNGNPFDAFVSNQYQCLDELPLQARVGTSSLRRKCQLLMRRPDLIIEPLRGNVPTRLQKLDENHFDAIILAHEGLARLGLEYRIKHTFSAEEMLPAIGQGVLAIEARNQDDEILELIKGLDHSELRQRIEAERAFNRTLEGGCHIPIGAYAQIFGTQLLLRGFLGHEVLPMGLYASIYGSAKDAESLGISLAKQVKKLCPLIL